VRGEKGGGLFAGGGKRNRFAASCQQTGMIQAAVTPVNMSQTSAQLPDILVFYKLRIFCVLTGQTSAQLPDLLGDGEEVISLCLNGPDFGPTSRQYKNIEFNVFEGGLNGPDFGPTSRQGALPYSMERWPCLNGPDFGPTSRQHRLLGD